MMFRVIGDRREDKRTKKKKSEIDPACSLRRNICDVDQKLSDISTDLVVSDLRHIGLETTQSTEISRFLIIYNFFLTKYINILIFGLFSA